MSEAQRDLRILVSTDFSPASFKAVEVGMSLAARMGAHVTLLHAFQVPLAVFPEGSLLPSPERVAELSDMALVELERIAKEAGVKHPKVRSIRPVLRAGAPAEEIVAASNDEQADFIVMGTHARGLLGRALLGSVGDEVVKGAAVPVMIVRADES
jgi:nucleotide-binding universal stress UspA family protein